MTSENVEKLVSQRFTVLTTALFCLKNIHKSAVFLSVSLEKRLRKRAQLPPVGRLAHGKSFIYFWYGIVETTLLASVVKKLSLFRCKAPFTAECYDSRRIACAVFRFIYSSDSDDKEALLIIIVNLGPALSVHELVLIIVSMKHYSRSCGFVLG